MESHSSIVLPQQAAGRMELISSPQMEREEERRMLPCRFFSNGFCHKGNRCRFYHPTPANMHNIIRVPPLPAGFGGPDNRNRSPNQHGHGQGHGQPIQAHQDMNMSRNYPMQQGRGPQHQNPYLMAINANGMGMGSMASPNNNNGRRARQYDVPGLNYTGTNVNGLQTYDYANGDQSAIVHQQIMEPSTSQTTLFTHIDWSDFLAPGKLPPPITAVPEQDCQSPSMLRKYRNSLQTPNSFGDQLSELGDSSGDEKIQPSLSNEDMPPEGSMVRRLSESGVSEEGDGAEDELNRKLSAKEELQMKVKQIALELADEPLPPVRSLDSFFRDYDNVDFLPAAMLVGVSQPRKKLQLREDPRSSTSVSSSGDEGSGMSDSSRNDEVMEAMKVIEAYLPERMKITANTIPEMAESGIDGPVMEAAAAEVETVTESDAS